jgi:hypothetical protein
MVIGLHERRPGHASRVRVLDRIFTRVRDRADMWWAPKDQITQWILAQPGAWVDPAPAPVSGMSDGAGKRSWAGRPPGPGKGKRHGTLWPGLHRGAPAPFR